MNKLLEQAIAMKDEIISYRRTIHNNPEVGTELPKTKAYVMDKLREFGYEPKEICESGIVATIEGSKSGKTFLLRADMMPYQWQKLLVLILNQIMVLCIHVVMICIQLCF